MVCSLVHEAEPHSAVSSVLQQIAKLSKTATLKFINSTLLTLVLHTNDYCGKRFGDNRRFQYTSTALCRSYKEGPRKVGCVREVSDGQVVAR